MATAMTAGNLFVNGPILIYAVLFLASEFNKILQRNPSAPVISMGKTWIEKGAGMTAQNYGRQVKSDMEVYCGFYLIGMVFLGGANFLSVILFWQMQRMRYMISVPL